MWQHYGNIHALLHAVFNCSSHRLPFSLSFRVQYNIALGIGFDVTILTYFHTGNLNSSSETYLQIRLLIFSRRCSSAFYASYRRSINPQLYRCRQSTTLQYRPRHRHLLSALQQYTLLIWKVPKRPSDRSHRQRRRCSADRSKDICWLLHNEALFFAVTDFTNITTSAVKLLHHHICCKDVTNHHICCKDVTNITTSAVKMLRTSPHLL